MSLVLKVFIIIANLLEGPYRWPNTLFALSKIKNQIEILVRIKKF